MIRTLIVDDEPLARRRLRRLLADEPDVALVGECTGGGEAVAAVRRLRPDLVFLDVQMPVLDGFGVLEALAPDPLPVVVFVTAFDRYALRAFDVHALDYLLKPFDRARFQETLARARTHLERRNVDALRARLTALLERTEPAPYPDRLALRDGGRVSFLDVNAITWIEAAGNYALLHTDGRTHLLRETMRRLERRLDPARFVRIHRSHIVRLDRIAALRPTAHGGLTVTLRDGTTLQASRGYRDRLRRLLPG